MKKIVFACFCLFAFLPVARLAAQDAQTGSTTAVTALKIGYINSNDLLEILPEKKEAAAVLQELNKRYKDELQVMQNDYNKKYSDFITFQNSMGDNIKLRRMQELFQLEKNINDFIKVAQTDVETQEKRLVDPLRALVKKAVADVGLENNYICIYDLASPSVAFLSPQAVNLEDLVKQKLLSRK